MISVLQKSVGYRNEWTPVITGRIAELKRGLPRRAGTRSTAVAMTDEDEDEEKGERTRAAKRRL